MIDNFIAVFRQTPYCPRPFWMRVRHGLIAALARDSQVMVNVRLVMGGDPMFTMGAGDMIVGCHLNTRPSSQNDYAD